MKPNKVLFSKIKAMSNKHRFRILELTQDKEMSITELSSAIGLAYNKTADYIALLKNEFLIEKRKDGKEVKIKSKVKFKKESVNFC